MQKVIMPKKIIIWSDEEKSLISGEFIRTFGKKTKPTTKKIQKAVEAALPPSRFRKYIGTNDPIKREIISAQKSDVPNTVNILADVRRNGVAGRRKQSPPVSKPSIIRNFRGLLEDIELIDAALANRELVRAALEIVHE